MIHTVEILLHEKRRRKVRGERFTQVMLLMRERGGRVYPSDLIERLGMNPTLARTYLRDMAGRGRLREFKPGELALKPGKWEPAYQLNLDL